MKKLQTPLLIFILPLLIVSCGKDDKLDDFVEKSFGGMVTQEPIVEMDPSGIAPLSARISLNTAVESKVEVEIIGSPSVSYSINTLTKEHEIPILGLFADSLNRVILKLTDTENHTGRDTFEIQTPSIPSFFPDINIVIAPKASQDDFMTMVGMGIGNAGTWEVYPMAFDTKGNIRWYMDLSSYSEGNYDGRVSPIRMLKNGNLCFGGRKSSLIEMNWLGFEENKWTFDGYDQHHEILELSNGNFILAVDKDGIGTVEDHIIEINRQSGDIVRKWDMRKHLDIDRYDLIEDEPLVEHEKDWFHMNGIAYNEEDQSLIVSGRHQGLIKVSQDDELQWILAPHQGWGIETSKSLLTAVDESGDPYSQSVQDGEKDATNFSWVWGQHAPMLLPNGNIFVFDNGYHRNFKTESNFSRGVEYSVNSSEGTVTQEWQYGAERGAEIHSEILSDVDVTETGTRILTSGIINPDNINISARVVEVSYPEKEVLFEAALAFKNELSKGLSFFGNVDIVYRSERFHFYK